MCKVLEGADVRTIGDFQNLVTSVILRQTSTFSADDILKSTTAKLKGSEYTDPAEILKRCKDTISVLYMTDCLKRVEKGRYSLTMPFPSIPSFKI